MSNSNQTSNGNSPFGGLKGALIDGKLISQQIKAEIAEEVKAMIAAGKRAPHLAVIIVGHDGGSETYVANKVKSCEEVGFRSTRIAFDDTVSESELLSKIQELNQDAALDGFIVQLPLPKHISEQKVIEAIDYRKDVDGFHPVNVGRLVTGQPALVPCTPFGCIRMLELAGIPMDGKRAVIIGRSNIVGKPLAALMLEQNATVTIAHSRTKNLGEITKKADVLVSATGQAFLVKADMVKDGAVVVDVGMNHVDGKLVGDVDFDNVKEKASYITPVPGGVGPLTVQFLMEAVVKLTRRQNGRK